MLSPGIFATPSQLVMPDNAELVNQGWLQRVLFVESHAPTSLAAPRAHQRTVLTALMRRREEISSKYFRQRIEKEFAGRLQEQRSLLGLASVKVYRDVSAHGMLSFFLQFTRSHGYTTLLCRVLRKTAPPPYRIPYGIVYDNVMQMTFEGEATPAQLEGVLALLRSPDVPAAECTVLASDRQYTVYAEESPRNEGRRVFICFLVNRPPGMSRDLCQDYWRTRHADLALRNMKYLGLRSYLQVHTMQSPPSGCDDVYDGVVYAQKSSLARLMIELGKPDSFRFNNTVVIDETNFTARTPIMLLRLAAAW